MINNVKKNLLIFFGELRTFEYIIPKLKKLDEVDVIVSTWMESKHNEDKIQVDENTIRQIYPDVKHCNVIDFNQIENFDLKNNSWKIYYHWKSVINNLSADEYDNVIFHRCDFFSNWDSILDLDIEDDTIYLHSEEYSKPHYKDNPSIFWVNDYYFFGKFNIVKKFINFFNKENKTSSHFDMWEVISQNNIKFKNFILRGNLIKDNNIETMKDTAMGAVDVGFLGGPGNGERTSLLNTY
jgi:phenylpropionate dioxygenase-like ring-hydroxylating dioxygenase large terminal subunit